MKIFHIFIKKSSFRNFLILLFCFSFILCACSKSKGKVNDHSIYLPEAIEETEETVNSCYIIIPTDASSELIESADKLSRKISEALGISAKIYYDQEPLPTDKNARFIILGNTSYDISKAETARLKADDYLCTAVEKHIFLGGKSHSATIAAIDRFISDVLPTLDLNEGLQEEHQFEYFGEYLYNDITLNGYPLNDYTVVYPSSSHMREEEIAKALVDNISAICGVCPTILSDSDAKDAKMIICVGACFGDTPSEAKIVCRDSSIKLFGSSANQLADSACALIEALKSSQAIELTGETAVESEDPQITLMRIFPNVIDGAEDLSEVVNICREIDRAKPTILCFDFPSDIERAQYENNLDEYTRIGNNIFVLSKKSSVVSQGEAENIFWTDISIGKYGIRIIAANAKGENATAKTLETASSYLSAEGPNALFTITDDNDLFVQNTDEVILNDSQAKNSRKILLTVFAYGASASLSADASSTPDPSLSSIILTHPFFR